MEGVYSNSQQLWPWKIAARAEPLTLNTVQVSNEDQTQEVRLGPGTPTVTLIKAKHWSPSVSTFCDAPHSAKVQPCKKKKKKSTELLTSTVFVTIKCLVSVGFSPCMNNSTQLGSLKMTHFIDITYHAFLPVAKQWYAGKNPLLMDKALCSEHLWPKHLQRFRFASSWVTHSRQYFAHINLDGLYRLWWWSMQSHKASSRWPAGGLRSVYVACRNILPLTGTF